MIGTKCYPWIVILFLSKRAAKSFGGYASAQLRRLEIATRNTALPDNPDMGKVEEFVEYVNRKAVEGDFNE